MSILHKCPRPSALATITPTTCPVRFDQIQKLAFGRKVSTPRFDDEEALITDQATWTALKAAVNDSKIVVTPYVSGLVFPSPEPIKQGGNDNSTVNGVSELMGGSMILVPFVVKNISAATAALLRALCSESMIQPGETNLEFFGFATDNNIIHDLRDGVQQGFDVYNLYVPDVASEGFNSNNTYSCSFELMFGWSEFHQITKAAFNPRKL